ncbi:amino acid transporter AVT6C-like [Primulina huaijiensis]|uniref:amino acid transporter AVT6C-like n=1 Tax=Primulina huaijiensis TaxID=1492673 RepID=UPI003CC6ECFA
MRAVALLFIVVFVMFSLVLYRRVESLWPISAALVFLAVLFVGICSVMAISAIVRGETKSPRILPQQDKGASFFNLFTAVPVIVTAFTFNFNVHTIGIELGRPADMILAVKYHSYFVQPSTLPLAFLGTFYSGIRPWMTYS